MIRLFIIQKEMELIFFETAIKINKNNLKYISYSCCPKKLIMREVFSKLMESPLKKII